MFDAGLGTEKPKPQTGRSIQLEYCERYGITLTDMLGPCRAKRFAVPRQEAMAEVRKRLGWSYPRIGKLFGKDHSTILWACRKHGIEADPTASLAAQKSARTRNLMIKLVEAAL